MFFTSLNVEGYEYLVNMYLFSGKIKLLPLRIHRFEGTQHAAQWSYGSTFFKMN